MAYYDQYNNDNSQVVYDFSNKQTKGAFLTKVFGMMFLCLLITTVVAAGFGYGFQALLINTATADGVLDSNVVTTLSITLIVSIIALLVMSFVLPITFMRGRHNIIVPLMIYVVLMGILLSTFTFIMDWVILVEAFGITTIIFGVMGLLGYISKGRLAGIGVILIGLLMGAGLLSLMNWLMILIGGIQESNITISWIVSLMIFAFLMFVTLYDVYRIRRIAENGAAQNNNLVYYCAFILYSDFISILIRVIYFLASISNRRS
ncbi:MAG: Bax inhibitor-1 family protein [Bacilli bacterium]|nr:Bax inhibitor-1 family protein [Bacilli bacterium]